jgi:hypothetical protein
MNIQDRLAEPFDHTEVKWKPQSVKGDRALAICYIDARCVMDRLDDVFGVGGWSDSYELHGDGNIKCNLSCLIDGHWVTKSDVGGESEQPDDGDRTKAAFSDALKRAAVKFGVGRYLYRLAHQWVAYDPQKKRFAQEPRLPAWAIPAPKTPVANSAPSKPQTPTQKMPEAVSATVDELHDLIRLTGTDVAKLCQFFKVSNLQELTAVQRIHAAERLNAKIDSMEREPSK